MAVSLQAQGVREQRALVTEGVKKLLKQQQSPSQLAEAWSNVPLLLLFDWFCDWSHLILRYQLTQDEEGLGLADMRKVVQYLAQKSRQGRVLEVRRGFSNSARKYWPRPTSIVSCCWKPCWPIGSSCLAPADTFVFSMCAVIPCS